MIRTSEHQASVNAIKEILVIVKARWRALPLDTPEKRWIAKAEKIVQEAECT